MIVDLHCIETGDVNAREEIVEQRRARLGQLVKHERAAGQFGEDRK